MDSLKMKVKSGGKGRRGPRSAARRSRILGVTLPRLDWDASPTCQYLSTDVVIEPVKVVDGTLAPTDAPGLGMEVDPDRLRAFLVM